MTVTGTITAIRVKEITTITRITVELGVVAVVDVLAALDALVKVVVELGIVALVDVLSLAVGGATAVDVLVALGVLVIRQCRPVLVVRQCRPDEPMNILSFFAVEVHHAPQSVCAKDLAE